MTQAKVTVLDWKTLAAPAMLGAPDWFDVNTLLGKRGHKYLSEGTKYWLAACGAVGAGAAQDPDRHGIVVGTNFGAHRTLSELFHVAKESGSSALSPMSSPNFSINLIASHAAIKSGARRFNLTLTTPQVAGLDALAEAARQLLRGRCDGVLAGAAEEGVRSGAPMPQRLQGAMAASLVRAGNAGQGLASLSGFVEAHSHRQANWLDQAAQRAALVGARLQGAAWLASARVHRVADSGALRAPLERVAAALGSATSAQVWHQLPASHGCLEPLRVLHAAMLESTPSLFMYANQRGAFRAIVIDPIAPLAQH